MKFFSSGQYDRKGKVTSSDPGKDEATEQSTATDTNTSDTLNRQDMAQAMSLFDKMSSAKQQISRLWKVIFLLGGALLVAIVLLFVLGSESKIVPVVVKVDGNNQILDVEDSARLDPHHIYPQMQIYLLEQFVKDIRTVSIDGVLQKSMLEQAVAMTQGAATKTVVDYQRAHNPYERAKKASVDVRILRVSPNVGGSAQTTSITWVETARDVESYQMISQKTFTGVFTFVLTQKPPQDINILKRNPMGFYIRHISWSEDYNNG